MSDNENKGGAQKSIMQQLADEMKKTKRDAAKQKVKSLLQDHVKAKAVLDGIEKQIVEELKEVGEDEETIRSFLE